MKLQLAEKLNTGVIPVFILKEGESIVKHPFFKLLKTKEKNFLKAFFKRSPLRKDHSHLVFLPGGREAALIGTTNQKDFNHRKALLTARRVVAYARREKIKNLAVNLKDFETPGIPIEELAEVTATQFELANFEFIHYKSPPPEGWSFVDSILFLADNPALTEALKRGKIIGEEINKARVLSNTPGCDMTPENLATEARKSAKECGFKVTVFDEKKMRTLKMGGILGVGKGSDEPPRFLILEYFKGKRGEKPVVLIGKGVTFDTGGLNLKPEQAIYEMHMDMSGGAAVIHAIAALARLKVKKNVIGLVPAVENMPSGKSYHPGDLLRTMSGKTIEVLNTDAEGRIILADGLTYAQKYKPRLVIDVATLTGSAMSALGQRASAIFTTDMETERKLRAVGEKTGDFVWPLPLWEEYEPEIKGTFGDIANLGKTRYGGAITGAVFLWQFIKGQSWVHIDIAPRMTATEDEFLAKGSAGPAIALLVNFLRDS